MKKIFLLLIVGIVFAIFALAQEKSLNGKQMKVYETLLKKDWNGFGGKGNKSPPSKLIFEGIVDFPYAVDNSKQFIKKIIRIYKYTPPVDMNFLIPMEELDFSSTPEIAMLSRYSDYTDKPDDYWEAMEQLRKHKDYFLFYKIEFSTKDGLAVAIFDSSESSDIWIKKNASKCWEPVDVFGQEVDLLLDTIASNLDLEELSGSHEERMQTILKRLMENKLTLPPDIEEDLAKRPKPTKPSRILNAGEEDRKIQEDIKSGKYKGQSFYETVIDVKKAKEELEKEKGEK